MQANNISRRFQYSYQQVQLLIIQSIYLDGYDQDQYQITYFCFESYSLLNRIHIQNLKELFKCGDILSTDINQNPRSINEMYEQEQVQGKTDILHQNPSGLVHIIKGQRVASQFQKNYPKNIFIPIIEFLADMGLQEHYQQAVGTREEFQGKNVVSLSLIYQLLTKQWFLTIVNKTVLEANILNKILMNSKIKKKLFHLKVARILLGAEAIEARQYKKNVSKLANAVALEIKQDDELFQYPSATIYLLNFFLNSLKYIFHHEIHNRQKEHDSDGSNSTPNHQFNSKQEYKNLTKTITAFINRIKSDREYLQNAQHMIEMRISQRANEINKKYQLAENVPNWQFFIESVVSQCFNFKKQGNKITNSIFNQWTLDFKHRTNRLGLNNLLYHPPKEELIFFTPIIVISPPPQ